MTEPTILDDAPLPSVLPAWSDDIEVAAFDTEFVAFDPLASATHHIVGLGAVVFHACDGTTTIDDLVEEVTSVLLAEEGVDPELVERLRSGQVRDDITASVRYFGSVGLLDGMEREGPAPCGGCGDPAGIGAEEPRRRRWPLGR